MFNFNNNKKLSSSSIVLIGNFSPMMFQPYWFKHCGILSDDEFSAIEKMGNIFVSDQLTAFETENLAFNISSKRFTIISKKEPFELMLDTFDLLQEKLDSVLIEKFGINFSFHVGLGTVERFKTFGDAIAPKACWKTFFSGIEDLAGKENGLTSLTMRRKTDYGSVNLKLETSIICENAVYFDFNFHFEGNPKDPFDILDVNERFAANYTDFKRHAEETAKDLIEEVLDNGE